MQDADERNVVSGHSGLAMAAIWSLGLGAKIFRFGVRSFDFMEPVLNPQMAIPATCRIRVCSVALLRFGCLIFLERFCVRGCGIPAAVGERERFWLVRPPLLALETQKVIHDLQLRRL